MATKQPEPALEMLFDGLELLPESIPISTLSQAFSAVQRLATGKYVDREEEDAVDETDGSLRLLDVQRGSAVYRITGPSTDTPIANIRQAGKILQNPDEATDGDYIITPIEDLSRIARNLHCTIVLRKPGLQKPLVKVDGESYGRVAGRLLVEGDTSFTGRVERVGGKTQNRCALSVSFQQRMVFCIVENNTLARDLGQRLYQDVVVQGTAKWVRGSWKMLAFTVKGVYQPKRGGIHEAFKALHDAGGKGWDDKDDPAAFLKEVTGE
jgi:hypothetical protein